MKVFIAGASSAIGSRVASVLPAQGHDVAGLTRSKADARISFVHIDDTPVTMGEFVRTLAAQSGAKPPFTVPHVLARLAGRLVQSATGTNLPVSNALAKQELGWAPAHPAITL